MSGKQWAGRIVAVVQLACWCAVSGLLLNRGISNLTMEEQVVGRPARGFTAGVIMVSVSCIMLLLSPTFLLMKILDMRRRRRILLQLAHGDLPPAYDEVVERAPTYSSLFLVSESGEVRLLNENGPAAAVVPRRPLASEAAPRYSSLFIVTETGDILEKTAYARKDEELNKVGSIAEIIAPEGEREADAEALCECEEDETEGAELRRLNSTDSHTHR